LGRRIRGRRVYADLSALAHIDSVDPLLGPDGLACANDGRLAGAQFGGGRLLVLAPDAGLERIVALPYR
jgi:sugar lactone lactonase YvrE